MADSLNDHVLALKTDISRTAVTETTPSPSTPSTTSRNPDPANEGRNIWNGDVELRKVCSDEQRTVSDHEGISEQTNVVDVFANEEGAALKYRTMKWWHVSMRKSAAATCSAG